ncbi:hypothetical protein SARC_00527 [Sphaeroforma arctica JP610]|uniref:Uncharacterized protein n=1 Tax=Sphaeroforma arctica JP610 TaxID=667725 RepID=A0A0L0GEM5_9EUKA|nr:hypothetical protein SARC_00527 [Sphaeroforma arctica JP610]KNC87336.1 hypothetical protein SARC_00527 [Sphaeroforma arctica JP610]|eukprot:XP_014161238.1 hypothetical protein SARC_00527 [Sphaeroforma arctica JP610]
MSTGHSAPQPGPLASRRGSEDGQLSRNGAPGLPVAAIPSLSFDDGCTSTTSSVFYDAVGGDQSDAETCTDTATDTEGDGGSFAGSFEGSSSEDEDHSHRRKGLDIKVYTPKHSMFADPLTLAVCVRLKKYTVTTNLGQSAHMREPCVCYEV